MTNRSGSMMREKVTLQHRPRILAGDSGKKSKWYDLAGQAIESVRGREYSGHQSKGWPTGLVNRGAGSFNFCYLCFESRLRNIDNSTGKCDMLKL